MDFKGVWTALVTPFDEKGEIDWKALEKLLDIQEEAGVRGVVVTATTGEAPTLSLDEKIKIVKFTRSHLSKEIKVMAGSGGNSTKASVELSCRLEEAGAECLLIVTPYYNKPNTAGIITHFERISSSVGVPLCLYHVPGRTGIRLSADSIAKICEVDKVEAVKEASGDISLFSAARLACLKTAKNISFLSGDDFTYLASLSVGGVGCISVVSNVFAKAMVDMSRAFFEGRTNEAIKYNDILYPVAESMFCETNPTPVKAALASSKLILNKLREPLVPVSSSHYESIEKCCSDARKQLGV